MHLFYRNFDRKRGFDREAVRKTLFFEQSQSRPAMPGGFALPVWVCHSSIMRMRMESVTESCSDAVV